MRFVADAIVTVVDAASKAVERLRRKRAADQPAGHHRAVLSYDTALYAVGEDALAVRVKTQGSHAAFLIVFALRPKGGLTWRWIDKGRSAEAVHSDHGRVAVILFGKRPYIPPKLGLDDDELRIEGSES